jgi:alpha-beta hydrolase superfamily lysophospholipase
MSTGAPLAAWLATEIQTVESHGMSALILISPNFEPADKAAKIILWPGGRLLTRLAVGKYNSFEPQNEQHAYYWTSSYLSRALRPMMQAGRLGIRAPLEEVRVPLLVLYTENDEVVSIPALLDAYERFGSETKNLINVTEASDHNLAGEIISPGTTQIVVDHILRFLRPLR